MPTMTEAEAKANLDQLIDRTAVNHLPAIITGQRHSAVLVSEEDWSSIQETLYLLSIPGMRESIREGLETATSDCDKELVW